MDRRNFFKTMLMTPLFTPILLASQSRTSDGELYLISDNPEEHVPMILRELRASSIVKGSRFALLSDFPDESRLLHELSRTGLQRVSHSRNAEITLSFNSLHRAASPSFALIRNGEVWDIRSRRLLSLWEEIYHGRQPATGMTVLAFRQPSTSSSQGDSISVYHQGRGIARLALDTNRTTCFPVKSGNVSVRIHDGKASISDSSCRHHVCQYSPPISLGGERIICAPNHFLIQVEGSSGVDTVIG